MKIKKNAAASFSGIPAIVLGKNIGITAKKNEEMIAITFAFLTPRESKNIFLTKNKDPFSTIYLDQRKNKKGSKSGPRVQSPVVTSFNLETLRVLNFTVKKTITANIT